MYLMYYAFIFALFSISKENRFVWLSLCVLCLAIRCNTLIFDNDIYRVLMRCTIIFAFTLVLLLKKTTLSCYQSFILLLFLFANLSLAYDVANGEHIIIYNNFEAVIYGLVTCQFAGIIPKIWDSVYNRFSSHISSNKNKQVVDRV